MPELPEVETMCRGIAPVIGQRISSVRSGTGKVQPITMEPPLEVLRQRLKGKRIEAIGRYGKRVAIGLDDGNTLVIEPRMTGLVLLAAPPTEEHLRLRIGLVEGPYAELLFWDRRGLGTVRLHTPESLAALQQRLGPDALTISVAELKAALGKSSRPIKVALLDQDRVAGIGNLYAAEILFLARIHPDTPANQLRPVQWKRLQQAIGEVLREAIHYEGSTLSDGTYRNALNQTGGYQNHHRVYGRADEICLRCHKSKIIRIVQAGRATFYCPHCQRA